MSLSYDEALTFLKDVLQIPYDLVAALLPPCQLKSSSTETKTMLLHHIINGFLAVEPFQSISLMSTDAADRKRPAWPEIKKSMFLKQGGLCYSLNSFAFILLKTLGYNASLAHSTVVCGTPCPDNHVVILIRSLLMPGDIFLADVGFGFAMARAVSLEFDKESPVYVDSYHTYKLQKRSRNKICLLQQPVRSFLQKGTFDWNNLKINPNKAAVPCETSSEPSEAGLDNYAPEWREFYFFDPSEEHSQLEEFFPCFDVCYGDFSKLSMHSSPRALCWPGGRFQAILHSKLSFEQFPGELTKYEIGDLIIDTEHGRKTAHIEANLTVSRQSWDSKASNGASSFQVPWRDLKLEVSESLQDTKTTLPEEDVKIIKVYQRLFPQFPSDMVVSALLNWRKSVTPKSLPSYLN